MEMEKKRGKKIDKTHEDEGREIHVQKKPGKTKPIGCLVAL